MQILDRSININGTSYTFADEITIGMGRRMQSHLDLVVNPLYKIQKVIDSVDPATADMMRQRAMEELLSRDTDHTPTMEALNEEKNRWMNSFDGVAFMIWLLIDDQGLSLDTVSDWLDTQSITSIKSHLDMLFPGFIAATKGDESANGGAGDPVPFGK